MKPPYSALASALMLAVSLPAAAAELAFLVPDGVSVSPTVTVMDGTAYEYVYYDDRHLSELTWDMKPLVLYGAELALAWERGPEFSIAANAARSGKTGLMHDRDWLNLLTDGSTGLTHLAVGNAILKYAYTFDAKAGWRFPVFGADRRGGGVSLTPALGFRYMIWSWKADNGYIQYADAPGAPEGPSGTYHPWTESEPKAPYLGTAISYLQEWWMPELSMTLDAALSERVSVAFSARGSFPVSCNGVDRHYGGYTLTADGPTLYSTDTWILYYDQLLSGWLLEPGASATVRATDRLAFRFAWSRIFTSSVRGDTYKQASGSDAISAYRESKGAGGGAALDAAKVTVSAIIALR